MTAPGGGGADEIREQLAAALALDCDLPIDDVKTARSVADALLPTVQALIAKGAAAELRAAREVIDRAHRHDGCLAGNVLTAVEHLRDRADALDGAP